MKEEIEQLISDVVRQAIQVGHLEAHTATARSDRAALRYSEIIAQARAELEFKRAALVKALGES